MPDSLRKVLFGTLIGALVVGFAWHLAGERAKRAPAPMGGPPAAAKAGPGASSGGGGPVIPVVATAASLQNLALEVEALGTARASESVDVTAKVSNLVTAIRFTEGQQVPKGEVLVEAATRAANVCSSRWATAPISGQTRCTWLATRLAPSPISAFTFTGLAGAGAPARRSVVSQ